jgi:hypothetical protein
MKEHPIAFSSKMVGSILKRSKTMTRRAIKIQPEGDGFQIMTITDSTNGKNIGKHFWGKLHNGSLVDESAYFNIPYKVGDILWVREEHRITKVIDRRWICEFFGGFAFNKFYKELSINLNRRLHARKTLGKWQRARFLPKELARIWLRVTNVKVERLNEISEEDALKEGIEKYGPFGEYKGSRHPNGGMMQYRAYGKAARAFQDLWEEINGDGSWKANSWVWVVEFEVLSTTGKPEVI